MRFQAAAALSAVALLAGSVNADAQSILSEAISSVSSAAGEASTEASSVASSATETSTSIELPTFTVSSQSPVAVPLLQSVC